MRFGVMFFVLGMLIFMVFSFMWAAEEEAQKELKAVNLAVEIPTTTIEIPPLPTPNPKR